MHHFLSGARLGLSSDVQIHTDHNMIVIDRGATIPRAQPTVIPGESLGLRDIPEVPNMLAKFLESPQFQDKFSRHRPL